MTCFADSDAIFKLAALDLLDEFVGVIGIERGSILVLPTLPYMLRKPGRSLIRKYSADALGRAFDFVKTVCVADDEPDSETRILLQGIDNIDPGEALIFALAAFKPDSIIVTGDKRCLRALHNAPECDIVRERLAGRVICLEHILHEICRIHEFEPLLARIVPAAGCDTMIQAVFGSGMRAQKHLVLGSLHNYRESLRAETGLLLCPP